MKTPEENPRDCFWLQKKINGKQLANYLNISNQTVRLWTSQKKIPHYKIGRSVRYDLDEINSFLQEHSIAVEGK
ncbi:MAG: helix-turn-helix domain-containing protein [Spirochaetes bacterium]|nr:helix-turn-helix domain-containing protein [Spirochaetota bacterium]